MLGGKKYKTKYIINDHVLYGIPILVQNLTYGGKTYEGERAVGRSAYLCRVGCSTRLSTLC